MINYVCDLCLSKGNTEAQLRKLRSSHVYCPQGTHTHIRYKEVNKY